MLSVPGCPDMRALGVSLPPWGSMQAGEAISGASLEEDAEPFSMCCSRLSSSLTEQHQHLLQAIKVDPESLNPPKQLKLDVTCHHDMKDI